MWVFKEERYILNVRYQKKPYVLEGCQDSFCPFYDSIDIPRLSKQLFLEKKGEQRQNRLIAVQRMEDLEDMLKDCVSEE